MPKTALLPPFTALRLAWALTGQFPKDVSSHNIAVLAEKILKDTQDAAQKAGVAEQEKEYVNGAVSTVQASLRTLETIYKGRQLNFEENEKLRSVHVENIKDSLEFGKKAQDYLKALPAMTISAGGGVVALQQFWDPPDWVWWVVGLGLAGAGYFINLGIVRYTRRQQERLYVEQDYERNLYYEQYVTRTGTALTSLYFDLDRIHKNAFGNPYPVDGERVNEVVEQVVRGIRTTMCPYVHKHKRENRISADLWPRCETGGVAAQNCPIWEGPPPEPVK